MDRGARDRPRERVGAATVYLLCGLPFAGKTTLARAMADRFKLVHLETDAIVRERGLDEGAAISRGAWVATYREAERRLADHLADGRSVVYDATNFRRPMRDRLRRVAAERGARAILILVTPSLSEIEARRARNRSLPSRPDVAAASFAEVRDGFQLPGEDEGVIRYDPAEPIARWLDRLAAGGYSRSGQAASKSSAARSGA